MRKIEKRAAVCLLLVLALLLGSGFFAFRFVAYGGKWVSFAANRHLYNSTGQLAVGRVLDRDGDVLSCVNADGQRLYYENPDVRRATLHAVGDPAGNIGTGALVAFADQLSGYNLLTGTYSPLGAGNDLYLTIDARLNYTAHRAMNGRKGTVAVYNYNTGEVLCMYSAPTFDPADPPGIQDGDERYDGVYVNRFLSALYPPGSVFKLVTLAAALENLPELESRTFTCTGATQVGGETITCTAPHGELNAESALACSCNGFFAQLASELGPDVLASYAKKAGLTSSYNVSGLSTARGSFDFTGATVGQVGWAGVGQYNDLVNPCAMLGYMGARARGGDAAVPQLVLKTQSALDLPLSFYLKKKTGTLIRADTAKQVTAMMSNNVQATYGADRFPNMDVCAKSGTAEVGGGKAPNAWFAGFLRNASTPYAFVVLVENGGSGSDVAGSVAARVLNTLVNG